MSRKLFISYSHEDKPVAKQVAEALSQRGYEVFWDMRRSPLERRSTRTSTTSSRKCDAVVVLWSKHSVDSDYVKEEAEYAKKKSVLVPLTDRRHEPCPLVFRASRPPTFPAGMGRRRTPDGKPSSIRSRRFWARRFPSNLPIELTSFVGREAESPRGLRAAQRRPAFDADRGRRGRQEPDRPAGSSQGHRSNIRDGVWLVELGALSDPELIPKQVAVAMRVQEQADRPIAATLLEVTSSKEVLLVLDNCEHLIEGVAVLADELLRSCPGVRLLATSREPLGVSGETVWTLQPMPVPTVRHRPRPRSVGRHRVDEPIHRSGPARRSRVLAERGQCGRLRRNLSPARRRPPRHRAGRRPGERSFPASNRRTARRPICSPGQGHPHRAPSSADPSRRDRLELRVADTGGATFVPVPLGVSRRLHAGCGASAVVRWRQARPGRSRAPHAPGR